MTNPIPQRLTRNSRLAAGLMLSGLGIVAASAPAIAVDSEMVTLQFEGMVGDEPFACGQAYEIGAPATTMTALDFRFYVSEVALIDVDGNEVPVILEQDGLWQHQHVALIYF